MIKGLTLQNYRSFVSKSEIEIRPLTLLYGFNSAGKSGILRSLPLIGSSINGLPGAPLRIGHPATRGATFSELTSEKAFNTGRKLTLGLKINNCQRCYEFSWSIIDLPELKKQIIEKFTVSGFINLEATWNTSRDLTNPRECSYKIVDTGPNPHEPYDCTLRFDGLIPNFLSSATESIHTRWESFKEILIDESQMEWITSVRKYPERTSRLLSESDDLLSEDGENAADILASDWQNGSFASIGTEVSRWYETHAFRRLAIQWEGDYFRLMTETLPSKGSSPGRVDMTDAGEGLIQVLPILVSLAKARRASHADPRLLAFEEPESHLHPKLHPALAERFCETVSGVNPPTIIAETHSETLLLRVQREIASGLSPNHVVVHWIRQNNDGSSTIEAITFDRLGQPSANWPYMVFAEDSRQASLLLEKQLEISAEFPPL